MGLHYLRPFSRWDMQKKFWFSQSERNLFFKVIYFCKAVTSRSCKPRNCDYYFFFFIDSYWLCRAPFFKLLFYLFTESGQWDTLINITALSMNVNAADLAQMLLFNWSPKAATYAQHRHSKQNHTRVKTKHGRTMWTQAKNTAAQF